MAMPAFVLPNAQRVINTFLALDPEIASQFGELDGRCLHFDIQSPALSVYILPSQNELHLQEDWQLEPDCKISGTAIALFNMVRSDNPTEAISKGHIEITGDSRLAQRFSDILSELDIDWEEVASGFVGDFAAHRIGNVLGGLRGWLGESAQAMQMNTTEYLQEEVRAVPTPHEITRFMDDVDDFRTEVDRFEARLRQMERKQA